jgi:hypothetical protein
MKTVEITIQPDGEVKVDAIGFAGVGCKKATTELIEVLAGGGSTDTKPKPDFYATNPVGTKIKG